MTRNKIKLISLGVFWAFVVVGFNNCAKCGTNTGNPFSGGSCSAVSDPASPGATRGLLEQAVCFKISSCFGVNQVTCETQVLGAANMTTGLGLNPAQYPTLTSVYTAVSQGTLTSNPSKLDACDTAIGGLACTSAIVVSSFNSTNPSDFGNVYKLLQADGACTQIFQ